MFVQIETIEPNKTLVRSVRRNLKELGSDELVDLIHTMVLAASLSKTEEGRRVHASQLMGIIGLAAPILGDEYLANMIESANNMAAVVMSAFAEKQAELCRSCEDRGRCLDEEPKDPTIH